MVTGKTVWGPKVPTLKGTEASLSYVQCSLYLVSSSINVSLFYTTWLDIFWTELIFSWISLMVWNPWGKARSLRAPNLGYRRAESPEWFDVSQKNSAWAMMREQMHCCDEAANHQLPIAAAFWIIRIVSTKECSSLMQNLMQIHCSTRSVILDAMVAQYTCSLNSVYRLH